MTDASQLTYGGLSFADQEQIDGLCTEFENAWRSNAPPDVEAFVRRSASPELKPILLRELLRVDIAWRLKLGERIDKNHYRLRFPDQMEVVSGVLLELPGRHAVSEDSSVIKHSTVIQECHDSTDHVRMSKVAVKPVASLDQPQVRIVNEPGVVSDPIHQNDSLRLPVQTGARTIADIDLDCPQSIGRYRIVKVLGEGGFGRVYLAHDDDLNRPVAIKVPRPERLSRFEDVNDYRIEARTVAQLDHPHIVPVHDVGSTEKFPCFVVSKFIDGTDLVRKLKKSRFALDEAVSLVATVAEALHYAHTKGLVHRDIKPANILIDITDRPYVVDFGLALKEEDFGKCGAFAGTPAYMSPEQARGEGHRVDGRSDIFSLGVVFYEMLTGRRPFKSDSRQELLDQITSVEARPPRQIDDSIPKELERICLKSISKRASERYTTAKDFADDLRHFLAELSSTARFTVSAPELKPTFSGLFDTKPIKIIPKGLRSFDAHDADFFLDLLPGPRDRNGLPDSIRFWKIRIEEMHADDTFSVGLVYGPSGCGKSSLMKAGLLPRLSDEVIAVYVEATAEDTEARLLNGLRKRCDGLPDSLSLKDTLAALRRGKGVPTGKKVLLVLDQFEQWLNTKKEEENTELVQALRQCDGGRLQCIVMVRDDFWMAVTRFLSGLEIELLQGRNCAAADLFDVDHAGTVLAAMGRAFGKLPASGETSKDQDEFLKLAVSGLAQEDKVVCIRLALFAEMMKAKAWTPATLKEVGGTEGIGVTFLEETFASQTANPKHRMHLKAAQALLKTLLPESGADLKGHMRSHAELMVASGMTDPPTFEVLLRILDSEIRLITPTDPEGKEGVCTPTPLASQKYYQLTHDYLVPSLRDWLTRRQRETRRGRVEILLADRAAIWRSQQVPRNLLSSWELLQVLLFTSRNHWTVPERRIVLHSTRHRSFFWVSIVSTLFLAASVVWFATSKRETHLKNQLAYEKHVSNMQENARFVALAQGERFADAVSGIERKMRNSPSDPLLKYDAACVYSLAAKTLVSYADSKNQNAIDPRAEDWRRQAVRLLKELEEMKFFELPDRRSNLKNDPDLSDLKSDPGYIQFIKNLDQRYADPRLVR